MKTISNNIYSIQIPENWETESTEESVTVFDPNGTGAITISAYTSLGEPQNAENALEKFVKGRGEVTTKKIMSLMLRNLNLMKTVMGVLVIYLLLPLVRVRI